MSDFPRAATSAQTVTQSVTPAAKADNAVHADFAGNNASNNFPGPFTNPTTPRNVTVKAAGGYDGGDVTIIGTDQFGAAVTEVITPSAGGTVVGAKIFKTVTSATKAAVGANAAAARIGTGDVHGLTSHLLAPAGACAVDGLTEAATWKTAASSVAPTTAANGTRVFTFVYPI